jgi:hypothetical protein
MRALVFTTVGLLVGSHRVGVPEPTADSFQLVEIARFGSDGEVGDSNAVLLYPSAFAEGPDKSLYVFDAGPKRIIRFARSGKVIMAVGREGKGPGELQTVSALDVTDDGTLYSFDMDLQRVTIHDSAGKLKSVFNASAVGSANNSIVVQNDTVWMVGRGAGSVIPVLSYSVSGEQRKTLKIEFPRNAGYIQVASFGYLGHGPHKRIFYASPVPTFWEEIDVPNAKRYGVDVLRGASPSKKEFAPGHYNVEILGRTGGIVAVGDKVAVLYTITEPSRKRGQPPMVSNRINLFDDSGVLIGTCELKDQLVAANIAGARGDDVLYLSRQEPYRHIAKFKVVPVRTGGKKPAGLCR